MHRKIIRIRKNETHWLSLGADKNFQWKKIHSASTSLKVCLSREHFITWFCWMHRWYCLLLNRSIGPPTSILFSLCNGSPGYQRWLFPALPADDNDWMRNFLHTNGSNQLLFSLIEKHPQEQANVLLTSPMCGNFYWLPLKHFFSGWRIVWLGCTDITYQFQSLRLMENTKRK